MTGGTERRAMRSVPPNPWFMMIMPGYTNREDLLGKIPEGWLNEAFDDDGDGTAEITAFDAANRLAQREIDGLLGQRYAVPFALDALPPIVKPASDTFVLESIYQRRGIDGEANPYTAQANIWRQKLSDIGSGKEPLSPGHKRATSSVRVISGPAKAVSRRNLNS